MRRALGCGSGAPLKTYALLLFILKVGNAPLCGETKAWQVARPLRHAPGLPPRSRCFARIESSFGLLCLLESKGALWKVAVASDLGFGIRRHRLAPTSVLVWDVVLVVASPVCLREITMLEWLPHKMIFVVCPRVRD